MIPTIPLLLLTASLASGLDKLEKHPEVLWTGRLNEKRELLFLPETFFRDVPVSQIPLPDRSLKALSAQLAGEPKCRQAPVGDIVLPKGTATPRLSLLDVVKRNQVAVLARVDRLVPGWIVPYGHAGSLVQVLVLESFKGAEGPFQPGSEAFYLEHMGHLRILERTLCTKDRNRSLPAVGAEIVIVGSYDLGNPRLISTNSSFLFPVVDGMVLPAAEGATDARPVTLESIRAAMRDSLAESSRSAGHQFGG